MPRRHNNSLKCLTCCDLNLDPRPSKPNQFICHLNYTINSSLVKFHLKFHPLVCMMSCQQDVRPGGRTDALTDGQPKNIMPLTHLLWAEA